MARGFLFAVSGPGYIDLARQAAATVAHHHPDIPIDLFTDQPCDDPVFAQVHQLSTETRRPRFEAFLNSRFDKTICLDADLFVIAPLYDVFEILDHFDFTAAHGQRLNMPGHTLVMHKKEVPAAFPQHNSGVMGLRKSEKTDAFIRRWQAEFEASELTIDQPVLRELLYESDLRIATLPYQYNLIDLDLVRSQDSRTMAPRILHSSFIHQSMHTTGKLLSSPEELVGPEFMNFLQSWLERDETLNKNRPDDRVEAFCDSHPGTRIQPNIDYFAGSDPKRPSFTSRIKRRLGLGR